MSHAVLRPLAFGELLDQAFGLFRRNFMVLAVVSLVCSGLPALLMLMSNAQGGTGSASLLGVIGLLLSILGSAMASGASTFVVSEQYLGRELAAGDALARTWPKAWQIILTSMGVGIITMLGMILLIVPGVIAFTGLSLAVTIVAVEGLANDKARSRSWDLTKGHRWTVLGLLLIYFVILVIGFMAVAFAGALFGGSEALVAPGGGTPALIVNALSSLVTMLINPLLYCIIVVVYYDLRVRKEAFDLDLLASTLEHTAVPR